MTAEASNARWDRSFFGHPRGLSTLFFTEMWERFSYYGMRAILILFMTASVATGGMGLPTSKAGAIYGLYTSLNLLMSLPGGWVADRIIGPRRAVLIGGIVIATGHFLMAIPTPPTFYGGLACIIVGTGLLKPNMSTMVGSLYSENDVRRDAGFSIFYMGINIGAMLSPLVCGYLGENINWHYGFGAAGVGMTLGLIQYVFGAKYLGSAGLSGTATAADKKLFWPGRRRGRAGGAHLGGGAVDGFDIDNRRNFGGRFRRHPARDRRAVFRMAAERQGLHTQGTQPVEGDSGALYRVGMLLVGV